ncbi:alkaline phosphatase family protein [Nocardia sp. CDC159]|uniref:Alkaline phosphatase family protein n=1 Tax=Nocardia pulmonis TaxID=2951408 RepID=A0A9X2E4R2_9NOCA|nr:MULTISPECIES: alkaline phosphatase family protein [Nocardia]MCM6774282.1 alkaline phosphatase family protein [Nocardia pulmonis]MCM6787169.1 alkaline phosphatase family protein [Nocardia sp. CDC159]
MSRSRSYLRQVVAAGVVAVSALAAAGTAAAQPAEDEAGRINKVVVIGLDGTMFRKLQAANATRLPRLAAEGTVGQRSIAPHITISGPSWASVLTGVWDTKHGIRDNNFTAAPFAKYPTVFTRVEQARPALDTRSIATWDRIPVMSGSGNPHADVNIATPKPPADPTEQKIDSATTDLDVAAITEHGPDLLFTHLDQVDTAGHEHGGASREYLAAVSRVDALVGRIVDAVDARAKAHPRERWNIIVTCDHGHRPGGGHGGQTADETANFVITRGPAFRRGATDNTHSLVDVTPTVLDLLGVAPGPNFDGKSLVHNRSARAAGEASE